MKSIRCFLANFDPVTASWYVDDILSSSEDVMGMIANLSTVFRRMRVSHLRFNRAKCKAVLCINLIKVAMVNPPVPSEDHEVVFMTDASGYCIVLKY